jgi:predicted SnoaL-like aldol condensation-catalyzing enzyme
MNVNEKTKRFVLDAFDTLFNKRDYAAAEKFWSPHYIQHSAHIAPGREGLFNLVKSLPPTLKYEPGTVVAEGDFVIIHGRYSGALPTNWMLLRYWLKRPIPITGPIRQTKTGVLASN